MRTDESSSSDGPAAAAGGAASGSGGSGPSAASGATGGLGGGSGIGGSSKGLHQPQVKPGDSMSRIPGLKKELSHTNSISGPTLPRYGIQLKEEQEEELAEVSL